MTQAEPKMTDYWKATHLRHNGDWMDDRSKNVMVIILILVTLISNLIVCGNLFLSVVSSLISFLNAGMVFCSF